MSSPRAHLNTRWAVLAGLMSIHCVGVSRPTTLTVTADGTLGEARNIDRGCEGEDFVSERHRQISGGLSARYEHESGGLAGAHFRLLHDTVDSASVAAERVGATDLLFAVGGWFGYDEKNVGGDLGLTAIGGVGEITAYPYGSLRIGDLDMVWLDLGLGSRDPLFDGNVASIGVGFRSAQFRGRAGLTGYGHFLAFSDYYHGDAEPIRPPRLEFGHEDGELDSGGFVELEWQPGPGLGVSVAGVLGVVPTGRLGINWQFDGM